jgi:hypothetical protein
MHGQALKLVVRCRNVVLVVLLFASLASSARADIGADGNSTTVDDLIDGTSPDSLVSVGTADLSADHNHVCVVTASAEAAHTSGTGVFIFGLSMDAEGTTRSGSNRRIEMFDNGGINDDSFEEVSTTLAFTGVSGNHTFTFSARRESGTGTITVTASSITVVCTQKRI